ncbi:MAG: chitobiase/beta-hexosaminidase C-terminal domain-containing protein [Verrucomicrobiales bacterium]|nr:chitobiase/beta-hexosaminidase C-terminal domain-containing protein [Verrucomicrobiales bacterium]
MKATRLLAVTLLSAFALCPTTGLPGAWATEPPPPQLVGHWRFDEVSGTICHDEAGQHDGTLSPGGALFVGNGIAGGALALDRTQGGYASVPHISELNDDAFTLLFWMKTSAADTTPGTWVIGQHEYWHANGWLYGFNTSVSKTTLYLDGSSTILETDAPLTDAAWHQVAIAYDRGGQTSLYVDGSPAKATRDSVNLTDRGAPLVLGGVFGLEVVGVIKPAYTGLIDDVQAYSGALTAEQIDLLHQNPGRSLAELVEPLWIEPNGGEFLGSVEVSMGTPVPTAIIRYTLDGSDPTIGSSRYQDPITLNATTTVRARLYVNDFPASEIVAATFTRLPAITFDPEGGLFTNSVAVALSNNLGLGTVRYTTDGSDPVATSPAHAAPVVLTAAATIKACVFLTGFPVSEVYAADYARVYALDDGISNEWREQYFGPGYLTDPRVAPDADPDEDGWDNWFEFDRDTDPTDPDSHPQTLATIRAVPAISWTSVPGMTYRVLRKNAVSAPEWEIVLPAFLATEETSRYIDADAPATAIYQIEVVP